MITVEVLANIPLLKSLSDVELTELAGQGADVFLQTGEWLIREGQLPSFFILLSGHLEVVESNHAAPVVVNQYQPGDFFGEVPMLLGSTAIAGLRATEPSRVAQFEERGMRLLMRNGAANEMVIAAMNRRISMLRNFIAAEPQKRITVVGERLDRSCHELRTFLARNHVLAHWMEPDAAATRLELPRTAFDTCPVVVMPDGTRLGTPTYRQVAELVGLATRPRQQRYDVIVVGGAAGRLAAAVYGASEGLQTLLVEREAPGGQAGTSSRIANYLGFPAGLSGDELALRAYEQATNFGCDIVVARQVTGLQPGFGEAAHHLVLDGDERLEGCTVLLATGVDWRRLECESLDRLVGRGVYYGSSPTDALEAQGKEVFMVGAGNSAGQAAAFLSNHARTVTMLVRGPSLEASMSTYLIEQIGRKANISVKVNTTVTAVEGTDYLQALTYRNSATGESTRSPAGTLFLLIGAEAKTDWLSSQIVRDGGGYLCTGRDLLEMPGGAHNWPLQRDPYLLETSVPGIFAAGDVRHGSIKRVASGVGEGSMAIAFIHRYREVTIGLDANLAKAAALATLGHPSKAAARGI